MASGALSSSNWYHWTWSFRNPLNLLLVPEMSLFPQPRQWGQIQATSRTPTLPSPHAHGDPNWKEQGDRGRKFMPALSEVLSRYDLRGASVYHPCKMEPRCSPLQVVTRSSLAARKQEHGTQLWGLHTAHSLHRPPGVGVWGQLRVTVLPWEEGHMGNAILYILITTVKNMG